MSAAAKECDHQNGEQYPQVDFTPRITLTLPPFPPPTPKRLSLCVRIFRFFRKLIRKRQESAVVKSVKWQWRDEMERERKRFVEAQEKAFATVADIRKEHAAAIAVLEERLANRDRALSELQQKLDRKELNWKEAREGLEKQVKDLQDETVPKLKRELEVERNHVLYLKTKLDVPIVRLEAEIAIQNRRISEAEDTERDPAVSRLQGMLRGER